MKISFFYFVYCTIAGVLCLLRYMSASLSLSDIVDVINLVVVVSVFFYDAKQRAKRNEMDYRMAWYRTFDISENLKNFRSTLDSTKEYLTNLSEALSNKNKDAIQRYAKKSLDGFNSGTYPEKRRLETILSCISEQDERNIASQFNEFQDIVSKLVNDSIDRGVMREGTIDITLDSMEKKLTKILYETGLKFA